MPIKIKLQGFDELLKEIEAANGSMVDACESATRQSAQIMQTELKTEMKRADVKSSLISRMPQFSIEKEGNSVTAHVGYKSTSYNRDNPSDYFKAIFLNYGTPHRSKHGKVKARGFVQNAKKKARPKIKKQQKIALEKILERLKR